MSSASRLSAGARSKSICGEAAALIVVITLSGSIAGIPSFDDNRIENVPCGASVSRSALEAFS